MTVAAVDFFDESGPQRRRHVRREVTIRAQVRVGGRELEAVTENISPGGAFLLCEVPPGQREVIASFTLPHGKDVHVRATVRWRRPGKPPGIGVSFEQFIGELELKG